MTAIGFAMFVVCGLAFGIFDRYEYGWRDHAKTTCACGTIAGMLLIIAGTAAWLWRVMP
jgi:hypothetical protein